MSLTFGLFIQVADSGPHGRLVVWGHGNYVVPALTLLFYGCQSFSKMVVCLLSWVQWVFETIFQWIFDTVYQCVFSRLLENGRKSMYQRFLFLFSINPGVT